MADILSNLTKISFIFFMPNPEKQWLFSDGLADCVDQ